MSRGLGDVYKRQIQDGRITYDGAPEIEKFATVAHAGDDEEDDNNDA